MEKKYISLNILNKIDEKVLENFVSKPIKILCKNFNKGQDEIKLLNILYKQNHNFWQEKTSIYSYYVLEDDILNLDLSVNTEGFNGFSDNYNELLSLSNEKRIELLISSKQDLQLIASKSIKTREEIHNAIVACTNVTIMLNKVIFDDLMNYTPEVAKIKSKVVVTETTEIVKIISKLITSYSGDFSMFSKLIEQSDGSTIQHMTRTFVRTLSFLIFYNELINTGYITKLRVKFNKVYRDKYKKLLPYEQNLDLITLERVFKGGMTSIPESDVYAISIGFLLHDIGKQVDLEYFEGSDGFIQELIESHVKIGFIELLKRTAYPPEVSATVGFHHEYYGNESGYGPLKGILASKFPDGIQFSNIISYSLKDIYNGVALSFFSAKVLEIIDIYDALTDPKRKYRVPFKPAEAIEFIRMEYLQKQMRIDPILFDMFELYLIETGEIN